MDLREHDSDEYRPAKHAWQFSLFALLMLTTIVSICLALGVHFPRIVVGVLAVGVVQVIFIYSADLLMHANAGRTLRQFTATLWAALGIAQLIAAWGLAFVANVGTLSLALAGAFAAGGLLCWIIAWRRWP